MPLALIYFLDGFAPGSPPDRPVPAPTPPGIWPTPPRPVDPGYDRPIGGGGNYPSTGPVFPSGPVDPGYGRPEWGGGHPSHPIAGVPPVYPSHPIAGGPPVYPSHPIAGGPPLYPSHPIYWPDKPMPAPTPPEGGEGEPKPPGAENLPPIVVWIPGLGYITATPGVPPTVNPEPPTAEPK